jgi:hypothetical protein
MILQLYVRRKNQGWGRDPTVLHEDAIINSLQQKKKTSVMEDAAKNKHGNTLDYLYRQGVDGDGEMSHGKRWAGRGVVVG